MILWYHRKIESKSDESEDDDISPLEDCNDRDVEYLIEGKLLLKVQTKKDDVEQQGRISFIWDVISITRYIVWLYIMEVVLMLLVLCLLEN
jgi:hypothetical protein